MSDRDIRRAILEQRIVINPFDDTCVQPASVDLRLGRELRVFATAPLREIDPGLEMKGLTTAVPLGEDEHFLLGSGEFVLGVTEEEICLPDDIVGRLDGKSSLGRLGLVVHSTAGFVDPGWRGRLTLELSNLTKLPIKLWRGMKVSQISFMQLTSPAEHPYGSRALGSKYQGQMGPTPSRFYENYRESPSDAEGRRPRHQNADALRGWLKESRHKGSVTLFAQALGVTLKTVQDWVYGRATPSSRHWARLYQETQLPQFAPHQRELAGPQQ